MSKFYFADSSSLVKRHVSEAGSFFVQREFAAASGNIVVTAKISIVEVLSAFNRRRRDGSLSVDDYQDIANEFLRAVQDEYQIIDLTDAVLLGSKRLLENHPLRAGDAVQRASAIAAQHILTINNLSAFTFLGSDVRLLNAAQAEGLMTDDPQTYP